MTHKNHNDVKELRKCIICGAAVKHRNLNTKTCSPDCTDILHGRPSREVHFRHCPVCESPVDGKARACNMCGADMDEVEQQRWREFRKNK
jgi:predicted nucleic acid-binding Zn ribbon protein